MAVSDEKVQTSFLDYCEVCAVTLKNAFVSNQHINGKKHKRNISLKGEGSGKSSAKKRENTSNPGENTKNLGMKRNADKTLKRKLDEKDEHPAAKKTKIGDDADEESLSCRTCDKVFKTGVETLEHFKGNLHKSKLLEAKQSSKLLESKQSTTTNESHKEDNNLSCNDCVLVFHSESLALEHFRGKSHATKVLSNAKEKAKLKEQEECTICSKMLSGVSAALMHYQSKAHKTKLLESVGAIQPKGNSDKEGKMHSANSRQSVTSKQLEVKEKTKNTSNTTSKNWTSNNNTSNTKNLSRNNGKTTGGGGYGYNRIENNFDKGRQTSSNSRPDKNENYTYGQKKASYVFDKRPMSSNINLDRNPQYSSNFNLHRNPQSSSNFNFNNNPQSSYEQQNGIFNSSDKLLGRNSNVPQSNDRNSLAPQSNYHPPSSLKSGNLPYFNPSVARLSNISNDILRLKSMLRSYES